MAEDDLTPLLVIGGLGAVYLLTRPKPNPNKPAAGKPPPSTGSQVAGTACAVGVGLAGGNAGQAAAAGALCSKVAPYVVDGLKYAGNKIVDAGSAVAGGQAAVGTFILNKTPGLRRTTTILNNIFSGGGTEQEQLAAKKAIEIQTGFTTVNGKTVPTGKGGIGKPLGFR